MCMCIGECMPEAPVSTAQGFHQLRCRQSRGCGRGSQARPRDVEADASRRDKGDANYRIVARSEPKCLPGYISSRWRVSCRHDRRMSCCVQWRLPSAKRVEQSACIPLSHSGASISYQWWWWWFTCAIFYFVIWSFCCRICWRNERTGFVSIGCRNILIYYYILV